MVYFAECGRCLEQGSSKLNKNLKVELKNVPSSSLKKSRYVLKTFKKI